MSQQQLLTKAVLVASIEAIQNNMARARADFDRHPDTKKGQEAAMTEYTAAMQKAEQNLFSLAEGVRQHVRAGAALPNQYDKNLIEVTLAGTREKVMARLAHQPNISATLDMFMLLFQSDLVLNAHFSHMRAEASVQDRMTGNPTAFGLDGKPNAKGRNECDHCPHVV